MSQKTNPAQQNLSSSVQSITNSGTAGGTIYYLNLGGLKLCWGNTGTITASGSAPAATAYTIVWPSSFFTTIQSAQITAAPGSASNSAQIYASPNSAVTTTSWNFYLSSSNGANGATSSAHFFVIGT